MNIYQKATKLKLRFNTNKGLLSVEQLWDLNLSNISTIIKEQSNLINSNGISDELSFLDEKFVVNIEEQLKFDILKDIYITKKDEQNKLKNEADIKQHNQEILALINEKEKSELSNKSIEELKALLKK